MDEDLTLHGNAVNILRKWLFLYEPKAREWLNYRRTPTGALGETGSPVNILQKGLFLYGPEAREWCSPGREAEWMRT